MTTKRLPRSDFEWTTDLAYVVGLLTTDGCLSPDKRHISLTSCDIQLLKTFKKCLKITNKISLNPKGGFKNKRQAFKLQFGNVVFYEWLEKIGLTPNKSLTLGKLEIPTKHFSDFIRGHIDGDGSIIYYIDKYNTNLSSKYIYERLFVYLISGSKKHVIWLRGKIESLINIHGSIQVKRTTHNDKVSVIYQIKYSTREAKKLLNWVYYRPNLPCLKRKHLIAKPFLEYSY